MEVKERIVRETFRLLSKKSIRAITMDEIAGKLGISKRTLYENFEDKKSLVKECLIMYMKEKEETLESVIKDEENTFTVFITEMLYANEIIKELGYDLILDIKKYYPEVFKETIFKDMNESREQACIDIEKAKEQGLIKENISTEFIVNMIELNMKHATQREYYDNMGLNAQTVANTHLFVILRGVSTPEGMELLDKYDKMFFDINKRNNNN